ncbi:MAG TPA: diacylglycerol kinase family protein [Bacillales bacterium]|nr:diacylglycerol kinase family protein [Bacillales bacterium]
MDSKGNRKGFSHWLTCFGFAITGFFHAVRTERNMKVHLAASVIVMILMFVFHLGYMEKIILFIVIGIVLSLELVNTAIEHTVNLITEEQHPLAKLAKDTAAAAVLLFSAIAVVIAILIFLHHI